MAEYRTVEGEAGAVDTLTNLTTFGSETGVGPIKVPADTRRLVELWLAFAIQVDTDNENDALVLRLSGKGMANGDQDFAVASAFAEGTAVANETVMAQIYPVDIQVVPNENINVAIAATGSDVGLTTGAVTLVFA